MIEVYNKEYQSAIQIKLSQLTVKLYFTLSQKLIKDTASQLELCKLKECNLTFCVHTTIL